MTSSEWGDRLGRYDVREAGREDFWTFCPCHHDTNPSMHVFCAMNGEIRMKCFACGADGEDVCRELGLPASELDGKPMIQRRRRRQPSEYWTEDDDASLYCTACGRRMDVDVYPDLLAGGWMAQGRCSADRGCGMWMTHTVHGESRKEAVRHLQTAARESWKRMEDKTVRADAFRCDGNRWRMGGLTRD